MGSRIINDMTVWLLSVASLMEGLSFPRIRLHVCITRAIVHALDTFPRINWPRNYEMCRFQRATMGREAKRTERERRIRVCTYPTLTIRPRTHPAHPSNSLRTRDTGAPCVSRVLHGCVQPATCAPSSSSSSDLPPPRGEWVRIRTHIVDLHVPTRRVHHPIAISVELR